MHATKAVSFLFVEKNIDIFQKHYKGVKFTQER